LFEGEGKGQEGKGFKGTVRGEKEE